MPENNVLLKVDHLVKALPVYRGVFQRQVGAVHAVDDISFDVRHGETFGLVGESAVARPPQAAPSSSSIKPRGAHYFDDVDLTKVKGARCAIYGVYR